MRFFIFCTLILLGLATGLQAQRPAPFGNPMDSIIITGMAERCIELSRGRWMNYDSIDAYATDEFANQLTNGNRGALMFSKTLNYAVLRAFSAHGNDSLGVVAVAATGDTAALIGPLTIDFVFLFRKVDSAGWRIGAVRRQVGTENVQKRLETLKTTADFPEKLKPVMAREWGTFLLNNQQVRENFQQHRERFHQLLAQFQRGDSLLMVGRSSDKMSQLNYHSILWDAATEETPKDVVDEYLATATPAQRKQMQMQLRYVERLRKAGRDTLANIARRYHLSVPRLDSITAMMKELRVKFINTKLPWENAVQFTVDGQLDNVFGYIYCPNDCPFISPEEYYYLEDLGGGWWLFRST
ncbi:MAG: hypothetical protein IT211_11400 [Armatimonadetes bacterium]|nr:hypothetical protein [Armatimonadota bacterium]